MPAPFARHGVPEWMGPGIFAMAELIRAGITDPVNACLRQLVGERGGPPSAPSLRAGCLVVQLVGRTMGRSWVRLLADPGTSRTTLRSSCATIFQPDFRGHFRTNMRFPSGLAGGRRGACVMAAGRRGRLRCRACISNEANDGFEYTAGRRPDQDRPGKDDALRWSRRSGDRFDGRKRILSDEPEVPAPLRPGPWLS